MFHTLTWHTRAAPEDEPEDSLMEWLSTSDDAMWEQFQNLKGSVERIHTQKGWAFRVTMPRNGDPVDVVDKDTCS